MINLEVLKQFVNFTQEYKREQTLKICYYALIAVGLLSESCEGFVFLKIID